MRLLLFSDLHCHTAAAEEIVRRAQGMDLVVGAGDFGNMRQMTDECIRMLRQITCPAVLVPGNAESYEELQAAAQQWASATVLHGTGTVVKGISFFGIGGAIPQTPFGDWSYDFSETDAKRLLADCPLDAILVSHSPPQGVVDTDQRGRSLGSVTVRDIVLRRRPRLVVCGHIHASGGQKAWLGETPVVNAGPAGMEWVLE